MKATIFFLTGIIISLMASGQVKKHMYLNEVQVQPPVFTGISNAVACLEGKNPESIGEYISKNFRFPKVSAFWPLEGTAVVQFVVTPTGELTGFKMVNSVSDDIDAELLRILKTTSGMWIPGSANGRPVDMKKEVYCTIRIENDENANLQKDFLEIARCCFAQATKDLIENDNPKKALRNYNKGLRYLPNDKSLLHLRGLCKYKLGDTEGARKDWLRLKSLGGVDMMGHYFTDSVKGLDGYDEAAQLLESNK